MRRTGITALAVVGAPSCAPQRRTVVHPYAFLTRAAEPSLPPQKPGPLRVLLSLPAKHAAFDPDIALVFDRRLRALEPIALEPLDASLLLSTAGRPIPGAWRLVDSRTLMFFPDRPVAGATTYAVTGGSSFQALDGTSLASSLSYAFSTPVPELVSSVPADGARDVEPEATVSLLFNQPIGLDELVRRTTVRAGTLARPVPFDAAATDGSGRSFLLTPRSPLPSEQTVWVSIDASLLGLEGPLPAGREQHFAFETIRPVELRFACNSSIGAETCPIDGHAAFELSRPIPLARLRRYIRVEGGCAWEDRWRTGPGSDPAMMSPRSPSTWKTPPGLAL